MQGCVKAIGRRLTTKKTVTAGHECPLSTMLQFADIFMLH
jgi:hypothetical protein